MRWQRSRGPGSLHVDTCIWSNRAQHVCVYLCPEYRALFLRGLHRALPQHWSSVSVGSSDRIRMIDLPPLLPPSMALQLALAIPTWGILGGGGGGLGAVPCNPAISIKIRGCTSTTKPTSPAPKNGPRPQIAPKTTSVSAARRQVAFSGPAVGIEPVLNVSGHVCVRVWVEELSMHVSRFLS